MVVAAAAIAGTTTGLCCTQFCHHHTPPSADQIWRTKQLWEEFFSDPSQWRDNRANKKNSKLPDFKHRSAAEKALWIDGRLNPPWVNARLAKIVQAPQTEQFQLPTPYLPDKVLRVQRLWLDFFADPSNWWDRRVTKKNYKCPDFESKTTNDALWLESPLNPPWVKTKITAVQLSQLQLRGASISGVSGCLDYDDNASRLCQEGRLKEALQIVELMVQQSAHVTIDTYVCLLRECAKRKALAEGKRVHALIIQTGLGSVTYLDNTLINMYEKCHDLVGACQVFNSMAERNVVSWTTLIKAHASHGNGEKAIDLFWQMRETGIPPNKVTFVVVLKACAEIPSVQNGKQIHEEAIKSGFKSDVVIGNILIDMYARCGCIKDALGVFKSIRERNVISWTSLIAGFARQGFVDDALNLYEKMNREGGQPNAVTYVVLLKACASTEALEHGKQLQLEIIKSGLGSDRMVSSALIDMLLKCKQIEEARKVFGSINERSVVLWNSMLAGYVQHGLGRESLVLYEEMKQEAVQPDIVTFAVLLKACASIAALKQGRRYHADILRRGLKLDVVLETALLDMYTKCGSIEDAQKVFNNMHHRDVVSWNAMITGCALPVMCEGINLITRHKDLFCISLCGVYQLKRSLM